HAGLARPSRLIAVSAAFAGLVINPISVRADEFAVLPNVSAQAGIDTNPSLEVGTSKTVFIGTLSPSLTLLDKGDRLQYSLSARAGLGGYRGWERVFPDPEQGSFSSTYLTPDRSHIGFDASVSHATILDALEDNTGRFTVPASLLSTSVSTTYGYLLDPVDE